MEKIVRNYLEIKSLDELLQKEKPNSKYIVEKVFKISSLDKSGDSPY